VLGFVPHGGEGSTLGAELGPWGRPAEKTTLTRFPLADIEFERRVVPSVSAAQGKTPRPKRRSLSLRVYVAALLILMFAVTIANFLYLHSSTLNNARQSAVAQARFEARLGAGAIATAVQQAQSGLIASASLPVVRTLFGVVKPNCPLQIYPPPPFLAAQLDFIRPNGTVACSSSPAALSSSYRGASWFKSATRVPAVIPLVRDGLGKETLLVSAPVGGKGAVAVFVDLEGLGTGLAKIYGGPLGLSFIVTTANTTRSVAASSNPARWVNASLSGTAFERSVGTTEHLDLQGVSRLYGEATVPGLGWKVFAGASSATALAAANATIGHHLLVSLGRLLILLLALSIIYRRVTRPISKLSEGVRLATTHHSSTPIKVKGPAEVTTLVDDFNELISASEREVATLAELSSIVASSSDAIVGMTTDGIITSWNATAESIYGYRADEMIGRHFDVLVPPDFAEEAALPLDRLRLGKQIEPVETKRVRKDGSLIEASTVYSPIRDANDALVGISSVSRDISERKRTEAEQREFEERLLAFEQDEERERELRLVADRERIGQDLHDLVIQQLFATGMTLQSAAAMSTHAPSRERIENAVEEIDGTIRQIRNVIFATESRRSGGLRDTALELVRDARRILGFEPTLTFNGPIDAIVPDYVADQLLATLREAVSNVARHSSAGQVDVEIVAGEDIALTVADDGIGLDAAAGSSGKGLGNMKARAERLGGSFKAENGAGGGALIEWRVPVPTIATGS